jgi:hypothetical protein
MRLFRPNIKKLKENRNADALLKLLGDSDWEVRRDAAVALGELGEHGALDALLAMLKNGDEQLVIKGIITALGDIGDFRAFDTLVEIIRTERPSLVAAACESLGKLQREEGVAPLIDALASDNDLVRTQAALALGVIGDARAAPTLITAFDHPNVDSRMAIYHALKQIRGVEVPDKLVDALVKTMTGHIYQLFNQRNVMPGDARTGMLSGGELRRRAVLKEAKSQKSLQEFAEEIPAELRERVKDESAIDFWFF